MLRRGYGLGAMALTAGHFHAPVAIAAWPSGEFGPMGIEGSVRLGFRKELEAAAPEEREALFDKLVAEAIAKGQALNMASHLEIDDVIDPAETRGWLQRGAGIGGRQAAGRRAAASSTPGDADACGAALLLACWLLPGVAALPARATRRRIFTWTDPVRQPHAAAAPALARTVPAPAPLLLYLARPGRQPRGRRCLGQHLAPTPASSSLHLQHPGSDARVLGAGLVGLRAAAMPQQLLQRVADVRFVLDEAGSAAQAAAAGDWSRVRLRTPLAWAAIPSARTPSPPLAGQRYPLPAPALVDARPRAFVALQPVAVTPGRMSLAAAVRRHRPGPFLLLTGSLDGDPFGAPWQQRRAALARSSTGCRPAPSARLCGWTAPTT